MTTLPLALSHAAKNPTITGTALKVLIRLHESLDYAEFRKVHTWFVANQLHSDETTVRRGLILLEQLGYVERGDRDGNGFTFRLIDPESKRCPPPSSPVVAA